ncbi:hypothetical protein HMPREF3038_02627 [Akkermansia sp. KLE1797]|nr:hypothetical protein HMPREF3038_02627 [Akkermansia sp. KLE1797]KZA03704.1 hypothetical protein HMPREF1326_02681 [Akkermansia sp. KLE1605]
MEDVFPSSPVSPPLPFGGARAFSITNSWSPSTQCAGFQISFLPLAVPSIPVSSVTPEASTTENRRKEHAEKTCFPFHPPPPLHKKAPPSRKERRRQNTLTS